MAIYLPNRAGYAPPRVETQEEEPAMFSNTTRNRTFGLSVAFGLVTALLLVAATLTHAVDQVQAYV